MSNLYHSFSLLMFAFFSDVTDQLTTLWPGPADFVVVLREEYSLGCTLGIIDVRPGCYAQLLCC